MLYVHILFYFILFSSGFLYSENPLLQPSPPLPITTEFPFTLDESNKQYLLSDERLKIEALRNDAFWKEHTFPWWIILSGILLALFFFALKYALTIMSRMAEDPIRKLEKLR